MYIDETVSVQPTVCSTLLSRLYCQCRYGPESAHAADPMLLLLQGVCGLKLEAE
jgi:hypothetical protein